MINALCMTEFEPIGHLASCYPARFGAPRQPGLVPEAWGILRLRPELNLDDALQGLDGFTHLWLVFVFHKNESRRPLAKVQPPRLGGQKVGVFATRSPHRPNPIGLSVAKIERIERNTIYLSGIDMLDGTPVLDIKPYLPFADAIPEARSEWASAAPSGSALDVEISPEADEQISAHRPGPARERFRKLIEQTIALDPRATFLKGTSDNPNPYTDRYGFFLEDLNVVFRVDGMRAAVIRVEPIASARLSTQSESACKVTGPRG